MKVAIAFSWRTLKGCNWHAIRILLSSFPSASTTSKMHENFSAVYGANSWNETWNVIFIMVEHLLGSCAGASLASKIHNRSLMEVPQYKIKSTWGIICVATHGKIYGNLSPCAWKWAIRKNSLEVLKELSPRKVNNFLCFCSEWKITTRNGLEEFTYLHLLQVPPGFPRFLSF